MGIDRQACRDAGINYEEGVARFVGNAEMYERFLGEFVNDGTFAELETAMKAGNVKDAFAAAHTLKGLTGNLSLDALYKKLVVLTDALRGEGNLALAKTLYPGVEREYRAVLAFLSSQK